MSQISGFTNRVAQISKAGWLFADLFLVLAIVFLGSQGSVPIQRIWFLTDPVRATLPINSAGLMDNNHAAQIMLRSELMSSPIGYGLKHNWRVGLVITIAGGPGCDNGQAQATSNSINADLVHLFPKNVSKSKGSSFRTIKESYINFGCSGTDKVDFQFFFLRSRLVKS